MKSWDHERMVVHPTFLTVINSTDLWEKFKILMKFENEADLTSQNHLTCRFY